jgi:hypothetical protein
VELLIISGKKTFGSFTIPYLTIGIHARIRWTETVKIVGMPISNASFVIASSPASGVLSLSLSLSQSLPSDRRCSQGRME